MKSVISLCRLRELLDYSADIGEFRNRIKRAGNAPAGSVAGCLNSKGYLRIRLDGHVYWSHRLAWLYVYGNWPSEQIDHINRVRTDNRIANLREATASQNRQNSAIRSNNKSGNTGVSWCKRVGRWQVQICVNSKRISLGYHKELDAAAAAYRAGAAKYHQFNQITQEQRDGI